MNQENLTYQSGEQSSFNRELISIGVGAAAVIALAFFLKSKKSIPDDPPPIIIKSGSFVIESSEPLAETSGNPNIYKKIGFGEIKGVRLFKTNEISGSAKSYNYEDKNGVEVDIRLQKHTGGGWVDIDPLVTVRTEINPGNPKNFVLRLGIKLAKKGKPKPPRKERRGDDDADNIRFGRIDVREYDGGGDTFYAAEGDDYILAFYSRLE